MNPRDLVTCQSFDYRCFTLIAEEENTALNWSALKGSVMEVGEINVGPSEGGGSEVLL